MKNNEINEKQLEQANGGIKYATDHAALASDSIFLANDQPVLRPVDSMPIPPIGPVRPGNRIEARKITTEEAQRILLRQGSNAALANRQILAQNILIR
ncbi:MAG: hypothetical protein E7386_01505 [Ruminococcaceae bacterium]|nr:hypothetical protein [Oscillospiraceae bacterium]